MHNHDEIIELARRNESMARLAEDVQHHVSRVSLEEQEKFRSAITDLDATRTREIFQIIETATHEKSTMREILKRIADYLLPQPVLETPFGLAHESPFVAAQIQNGEWLLNFRANQSKSIDVLEIARQFNGSGNSSASTATVAKLPWR